MTMSGGFWGAACKNKTGLKHISWQGVKLCQSNVCCYTETCNIYLSSLKRVPYMSRISKHRGSRGNFVTDKLLDFVEDIP